MAKLPGAYETLATVGAPAINFARGILGYQDPFFNSNNARQNEGDRRWKN